jgi:hypothetical protein
MIRSERPLAVHVRRLSRNRSLRRIYRDETAYLLSSKANARWLAASLLKAETGRVIPLDVRLGDLRRRTEPS